MSCKCAKYDLEDGRYNCSVTGDDCMYMIPDSKKCAEEWGEGPDVDAAEWERLNDSIERG